MERGKGKKITCKRRKGNIEKESKREIRAEIDGVYTKMQKKRQNRRCNRKIEGKTDEAKRKGEMYQRERWADRGEGEHQREKGQIWRDKRQWVKKS